MSDDNDNYKFGIDDVGESAESEEPSLDTDSVDSGLSGTAMLLLPFSIAGVYAFVAKGVVLSALTSLFGGASGFALAVTSALWVVGVLSVAALGVVVFVTVIALLAAVIKRGAVQGVIGVLGLAYLAAGYFGSQMLFGGLPLLVGFFLVTNLLVYGAVLVIGGLVIAGAVAVI